MRPTRRAATAAFLAGPLLPAAAQEMSRVNAFSFSFDGLDGPPIALGGYAGKVLLVVNTASQCGYTPQFRDLQEVWERYRARGLIVIGVPSNDFSQEPGTAAEIREVCGAQYGVSFPMAGKQHVVGTEAHPFFRWAARSTLAAEPKWNFHKVLVGRDGKVVAGFSSATRPNGAEITSRIEVALGASG